MSGKRGQDRLFRFMGVALSLVLCAVILSVYIFSRPEIARIPPIALLEVIEAKTVDMRFRLRGERTPGDTIAIIVVDENTESNLGRWQSSGRRWLAELLRILDEGQATVVGFDLTLAELDEGPVPEAFDKVTARYLETARPDETATVEMLASLQSIREAYDYDRQLAEAIQAAGNVVLGYHVLDAASAEQLTPEQHAAYRDIIARTRYTTLKFPPNTPQQALRVPHVDGIKPNLPIFSEAAKSFGYFTVPHDIDGSIRHAALLMEYMGDYYPSLDLEIARAYLNPALPPIIHAVAGEGGGSIATIQIGNTFLPVDERGNLWINYYGKEGTFPRYSLSDVIDGKNVKPKAFVGKIVLVGFVSAIYQDVHSVPFQADTFPGVEVHATILDNILRQNFLTRPEWATMLDGLIVCVLAVALGMTLPLKHPVRGLLIMGAGLLIAAGIPYCAFLFANIWLNMTIPFLFVVLDYLTLTSYNLGVARHKHRTEEQKRKEEERKRLAEEAKKEEIRRAFQHYVSPALVEQIVAVPEKLELGGTERQLTAFFADVRGFTSLSETMKPQELVAFLNDLFTEMTAIVMAHGGTLDKYIGDAIMAFYGAPVDQPDHAVRACKTAVDMLIRLEELRVRWIAEGLPDIRLGIGLNTGDMVVGNIGSPSRFNYTIMGDAVNLASRLEGATKQYGTSIILSRATCQHLDESAFWVRELDTVRVKGKQEPVTMYELLGYENYYQDKRVLATMFREGVDAYAQRKWTDAITIFQNVLKEFPQDTPSQIYLKRCKKFLKKPPPDDWDGVLTLTTK